MMSRFSELEGICVLVGHIWKTNTHNAHNINLRYCKVCGTVESSYGTLGLWRRDSHATYENRKRLQQERKPAKNM